MPSLQLFCIRKGRPTGIGSPGAVVLLIRLPAAGPEPGASPRILAEDSSLLDRSGPGVHLQGGTGPGALVTSSENVARARLPPRTPSGHIFLKGNTRAILDAHARDEVRRQKLSSSSSRKPAGGPVRWTSKRCIDTNAGWSISTPYLACSLARRSFDRPPP